MSIDDGCASDVRVAELASKYEIETIFYWPAEWHSLAYDKGYTPLHYGDAYLIAQGFEIGSHGLTHKYLTKIPFEEAAYEIIASKSMLQQLFKVPVNKFCYPRGYANDQLNELVLQHYESYRLTKEPGLVHIHPDSGANDNKPWQECVNEKTKELWCHSYDLDKFNMWNELEQFLKEQNERR